MTVTRKVFVKLILLAMIANILAQTIHETGHMLVYQAYGRNPVWGFIGLVQWWDTPPENPGEWVETTGPEGEPGWYRLSSLPDGGTEEWVGHAAGPLASLLAGFAGLALAYRGRSDFSRGAGLMLAMVISFIMFLYYLRSPLRSGGDEAGIAAVLGVSRTLVEVLFGAAFLGSFVLSLRALPSFRVRMNWLGAVLLGSIPTGILLVLADGIVREQINLGNPWFFSLGGYAFPVFLTNFVMLFLLYISWRRYPRLTENGEKV